MTERTWLFAFKFVETIRWLLLNVWELSFHHSLSVTHSLTHSMNLEMPSSILGTTLRSTGTYNTFASGIVLCHFYFFIGKISKKKDVFWREISAFLNGYLYYSLIVTTRTNVLLLICLWLTWPELDQSSECKGDGNVSLFCFSPLTKLFYAYCLAIDWKE